MWFPPIFLTIYENFPSSALHFTQNCSPQTNLILSSLPPPTHTHRTPLIKNYLKSYLPLKPFPTANPIHSFNTRLLSISVEVLGRYQRTEGLSCCAQEEDTKASSCSKQRGDQKIPFSSSNLIFQAIISNHSSGFQVPRGQESRDILLCSNVNCIIFHTSGRGRR